MITQRVCVLLSSAITDALREPFEQLGALVDWGALDGGVQMMELNALGFEPDAKAALNALSHREKVLFFWAYNSDLDRDIDSAGMHKAYGYSWGFSLLHQGASLSAVTMHESWPTYGEGLQARIAESVEAFRPEPFAGFLDLDTSVVDALRDLFDAHRLFAQFEAGERDQLAVRDAFLEAIGVDIR